MDTDFLTRALSRLKSIHIAMRDAILAHTQGRDLHELADVAREASVVITDLEGNRSDD